MYFCGREEMGEMVRFDFDCDIGFDEWLLVDVVFIGGDNGGFDGGFGD